MAALRKTSRKKLFIYITAALMMLAMMAAIGCGKIRRGEIIFIEKMDEEPSETTELIIETEDIELVSELEGPVKYEYRTEFIVNINNAGEEDMIRLLPGIGSKRAAAIVEYRELSGGFESVEELSEVEGIGEKLLEELRPFCTTEGEAVQYVGKRDDLPQD